jgi:hypothetical protein
MIRELDNPREQAELEAARLATITSERTVREVTSVFGRG